MENIEWNRFWRLKVIRKTENEYFWRKVECICDCGHKVTTHLASLLKWSTKSCGCLQIERSTKHWHNSKIHGISPTYISRTAMKARCTNKKLWCFKYYWLLWINFCERWFKFEKFLEDMGERPEWKTLDRIDNSKGYSKDNCRRATIKQQNNNRRSNRFIEYEWEKYTLANLSIKMGVKRTTLSKRIKDLGLEKALQKR